MFVKGLLIGIVICISIGAILFFIKTDISVTEKVNLDKSSFEILNEIVDLKNFQKWDPSAVKDSAVTIEFIGEPGVGMRAITKGVKGIFISEYEVLEIEPLESAKLVLRLVGVSDLIYTFKVVDLKHGSELTWNVNFRAPLFATVVGVHDKIKNEFKKGFNVLKKRLKHLPTNALYFE